MLSIVVASNGTPGSVAACLRALEPQADDEEIIVREREGALVPELWREGIDAATGDTVCLTISVMRPAPDWVATARRVAGDAVAVGGAIEPGEGLRLRDWAEYFCRYARDMLPFEERESPDLPGDNAIYARAALEATRDLYRDGFWEPEVHRALEERGDRLLHTPELVVYQGRSAGFAAFCHQRYTHGREYASQRGARFSNGRNVAGVVGSPLVPLLLTARTLREVFGRRRCRARLMAALPCLLVFDVAWAAGEAVGHVRALRTR